MSWMWESWSDKSGYLLCLLHECFPPLNQLKAPTQWHMHISQGALLSDLQAPHLHCLQWSMWSNIHSCHVIACLDFGYHFARPNFIFHSFPSNFPSKTSIVLCTCLISEASGVIQSQGTYFNITCWPLLQAPVLLLFHFSIWLQNVHYPPKW